MALLRNRFLLGIAALVLLLGVVWAYFAYLVPQPPSRPLIIFEETIPESGAVAGQPVVVFAVISDPQGISNVELWVNGQLLATQTNDQGGSLPFNTSLAFIPSGAGNYLIVLKALDGDGFLGESEPLPIQVNERTLGPEPDLLGEYILQEGDTPEDIAANFGITAEELMELNPEAGDYSSGGAVLVPSLPETDTVGDAGEPPEGGEDIPRVDPPLPPSEPREAFDADPASEPWWGLLPLPDGFICFINPSACGRAIDIEPPPFPAPRWVGAAREGDGCELDVYWTDGSENEDGFRIYRFVSRPRFRMDLLEIVGPASGSETRLHFEDTSPPRGTFFYAVVAFNAGGDTWSGPSETIVSEGCPPSGPVEVEALVIEGLEMELSEPADRLYCYASLADSPFVRIPFGASSFIEIASPLMNTWDIAEYFSGENKREVWADSNQPLAIAVECMAWQGEDLINLGRFTNLHPREDWGGTLLSGSPASGNFTLTYRINASFHAADEGGRAAWPIVLTGVLAPFNLHITDEWARCSEVAGARPTCVGVDEPGLGWSYRVEGDWYPISYKVYRRLPGQVAPTVYYESLTTMWTAPLATGLCHERVFYSVSAVVGHDPVTGEEWQSPLSDEFEVPPSCASLEITLDFLWVYYVDDGDPCSPVLGDCFDDYEAYGWLAFNGHRIQWNDHCDAGLFEGCIYVGPSYTAVWDASEYNWADFNLNSGDGWGRGNNVIRIPIGDGEALGLTVNLSDHDEWPNGDDFWCGGTGRTMLTEGPHSAAEWLAFDQTLAFDAVESRSGECIVGFHVRGMPPD